MSSGLKHPQRSRRGQTLIEFTLVLVLFLGMFMLTVNAVIAFTVQQYFSFVTFMGARAYQAARTSPDLSRIRACDTFQRYILDLPSCDGELAKHPVVFRGFSFPLARVERIDIPEAQQFKYGSGAVREGSGDNEIKIEFSVNLLQTPFFRFPGDLGRITISSNSFLGREVSRQECRSYFESILRALVVTASGVQPDPPVEVMALAMEDNGC